MKLTLLQPADYSVPDQVKRPAAIHLRQMRNGDLPSLDEKLILITILISNFVIYTKF